jgi:plasmid maintenance system antidote protein VapI
MRTQTYGGDNLNRVNIEAERGRLQMTKTDMCQELGVTLKTYNGYIRGAVIPSDILEQLRKMTGQSIDYLLGLDAQNSA